MYHNGGAVLGGFGGTVVVLAHTGANALAVSFAAIALILAGGVLLRARTLARKRDR